MIYVLAIALSMLFIMECKRYCNSRKVCSHDMVKSNISLLERVPNHAHLRIARHLKIHGENGLKYETLPYVCRKCKLVTLQVE